VVGQVFVGDRGIPRTSVARRRTTVAMPVLCLLAVVAIDP
jgi:hypothetical protein